MHKQSQNWSGMQNPLKHPTELQIIYITARKLERCTVNWHICWVSVQFLKTNYGQSFSSEGASDLQKNHHQ